MQSKAGTPDADTDMNGDGVTDADDLTLLANRFGMPPGPSGLKNLRGRRLMIAGLGT